MNHARNKIRLVYIAANQTTISVSAKFVMCTNWGILACFETHSDALSLIISAADMGRNETSCVHQRALTILQTCIPQVPRVNHMWPYLECH